MFCNLNSTFEEFYSYLCPFYLLKHYKVIRTLILYIIICAKCCWSNLEAFDFRYMLPTTTEWVLTLKFEILQIVYVYNVQVLTFICAKVVSLVLKLEWLIKDWSEQVLWRPFLRKVPSEIFSRSKRFFLSKGVLLIVPTVLNSAWWKNITRYIISSHKKYTAMNICAPYV